jgi:hypothetical protein
MTTPTPRPWAPATVNDLPHGEPDIQFAVYAVNHIEHAEAALREAVRLLADVDIIEGIIDNRLRRSVLAFLAAHAAPEEKTVRVWGEDGRGVANGGNKP